MTRGVATQNNAEPSGWSKLPLGEVGRWHSGGTPSLAIADYWGGDLPWVSPKDMKAPRLHDAIDHISNSAVAAGATVLPAGAILMVVRGMILAHSMPVARAERPLSFNQDIKAVVCRDQVDSEFLLYWFLSHARRLLSLTTESTHGTKRLPTETLFREVVACPSVEEQRAIATVLSDVDALLAKLDQLIAKKRDLKQAAMQQLLTGRIRLPGFADAWRNVTIGDVADVKTGPFGSSLHESDYVDNGTPIITVEHLGERSITRQNLPLVSDEDCRRLRAYSLQPGDVVFSRVGSIDRNALVTESESGWLFSGRLLRVRVRRDRADPAFLSHQFHGEPFKQRVREVAVGQTMPSLNTQILRRLPVALPALAEQQAIAQVLSDMDAELTALEARRDKTRQLKQGMMQALLTGRIRLV